MHLWQDSFKITFDINLEKEKKLRKKKFSVRTDTAVYLSCNGDRRFRGVLPSFVSPRRHVH